MLNIWVRVRVRVRLGGFRDRGSLNHEVITVDRKVVET